MLEAGSVQTPAVMSDLRCWATPAHAGEPCLEGGTEWLLLGTMVSCADPYLCLFGGSPPEGPVAVLMIQTNKPAREVRFASPRMGRGRSMQDEASNDDACHLLEGMKHVYRGKASLLFVRFNRSSMGE